MFSYRLANFLKLSLLLNQLSILLKITLPVGTASRVPPIANRTFVDISGSFPFPLFAELSIEISPEYIDRPPKSTNDKVGTRYQVPN